MDIMFYEAFHEEAEALRRCLDPTITAGFTAATIQESGDLLAPAAIISVRTQSAVPPDWAHDIALLTRSTGYDHLLAYRSATASQRPFGYLPLYCHRAVAEHAMLLWTALLRRLPRQQRQWQHFDRDHLTGRECAGKTLVVVGVGHIGSEIIRIGTGLDMDCYGVDIDPWREDVNYCSSDEGLARADVLVCAMPLTDSNAGYFNRERFAQCHADCIFVNVSRGELSPSTELLAALEAGSIAGVGLDTFDDEAELAIALRSETTPRSHEARAAIALAAHDSVICTPHNAFNTIEAVQRKAEHSAQQISHYMQHHRFLWPVPGTDAHPDA